MNQKIFERTIAIIAIVLFLFFFFAYCANAATKTYTCGDLVSALQNNNQTVLTDSARQTTLYIQNTWPDIAKSQNSVNVLAIGTVAVCTQAVKENQPAIALMDVVQAVAVEMEGMQ